jgi:hypothetical protein
LLSTGEIATVRFWPVANSTMTIPQITKLYEICKVFLGSGGLGGGQFGADEDGGAAGDAIQRVLVEDGGHGPVEVGQVVAELHGAFEEHLDGYGPEFVVVGGGIVAKQVFCAALLHGREDGAGHLGEIGEFLFKMPVFFGLGDEIHICECVGHFVEPDVAVGGLTHDTPHKVVPREIDTRLVYVSHKGPGIEPIVVVIAQDEDIVKIIEFEFVEAQGQLNGCGADQDGHLCRLFDFYVVKVLGMLEQEGAEEEFPLFIEPEAVVVTKVTGDDGMIEGLAGDKTLELMLCVETLNKQRNRAIQK